MNFTIVILILRNNLIEGGDSDTKTNPWEGANLLKMERELSFLFIFFLCLFRAAPGANGGSQARGRIGAVAACLYYSHSNVGSEPCL